MKQIIWLILTALLAAVIFGFCSALSGCASASWETGVQAGEEGDLRGTAAIKGTFW